MPTTRHLRHTTIAATSVSAAASWALVTHVAGVHLSVRFPHSTTTTVGLGTIMAAAAAATLLGWGLLAALERRAAHPRTIWVIAAVVVLLASLGLPIAFATTFAAAAGLVAIHLTVAAVAVIGLAGVSPHGMTSATAYAPESLGRPPT